MILLAYKYLLDPREAFVVNANLGGDSCHRGSLLGALLGSARGAQGLPQELVCQLFEYGSTQALAHTFAQICTGKSFSIIAMPPTSTEEALDTDADEHDESKMMCSLDGV